MIKKVASFADIPEDLRQYFAAWGLKPEELHKPQRWFNGGIVAEALERGDGSEVLEWMGRATEFIDLPTPWNLKEYPCMDRLPSFLPEIVLEWQAASAEVSQFFIHEKRPEFGGGTLLDLLNQMKFADAYEGLCRFAGKFGLDDKRLKASEKHFMRGPYLGPKELPRFLDPKLFETLEKRLGRETMNSRFPELRGKDFLSLVNQNGPWKMFWILNELDKSTASK